MSDGYPSMTALLGLLAIAGFQNRDKIAEMLGGSGGGASQPGRQVPDGGAGAPQGGGFGGGQGSGQGGLGGGLSGALGGLFGNSPNRPADAGGFLGNGLNELVERFRTNGHGEAANSWVGAGPNRDIAPNHLEQAIGPDVLATLAQRTGLSRDELLSRLSRDLPGAIDRYTPDGRIPA